jgi:hypothetical protein
MRSDTATTRTVRSAYAEVHPLDVTAAYASIRLLPCLGSTGGSFETGVLVGADAAATIAATPYQTLNAANPLACPSTLSPYAGGGDDTASVSSTTFDTEIFKPVVFAVMPYGTRTHPETGTRLDCDRLYREVIVPAAEAAGCRAVRSDHEAAGGVVHTSMFARLLLADVVVADLSLPNPNVYYELGVRHATRPRATITIGCFAGANIPFDVAPLRHLTYTLNDGAPEDPTTLRTSLEARIRAGLAERATADSPCSHSSPATRR